MLAGALRMRAVLPACSGAASLAAALIAPPVVAIAAAAVSVALLVLGQLVWMLLDEE